MVAIRSKDMGQTETREKLDFARRARAELGAVRREATAPRIATVGALALGAAAFGFLRNSERRERLTGKIRGLLASGTGRWTPARNTQPPTAANITLA